MKLRWWLYWDDDDDDDDDGKLDDDYASSVFCSDFELSWSTAAAEKVRKWGGAPNLYLYL